MSDQSKNSKKLPTHMEGLLAIQKATAGLNNVGEIGKTVRAMAGQVSALQMGIKSIVEAFSPVIALRDSVIPPWVEEIAKAHKAMVSTVGVAIAEVQRSLSPGLLKLANEMAELGKIIAERQKKQLEAFPALSQRIPMLAQKGWFISYGFDLRDFDTLAEVAKSGSDDELEQSVEYLYRENSDSLLDHFNREFPARQAIVEQAIHAHKEGWYALSIPVFFAQSDGVCMERTERHLFMGRGEQYIGTYAQERASALQAELEGDNEGQKVSAILEFLIWAPLLDHLPIRYSEDMRKKTGYSGLNRHAVLHGESLDYASEINSLKSFSLLSYAASLLGEERT